MALTVNWVQKVVYSDASIYDLPAHHLALRNLEASEIGMLHDDICGWQNLDLGGGAFLPQINYLNGYALQFIGPGPFYITGNLNCTINPTGVQIERNRSAAYATTSIGGAGGAGITEQDKVDIIDGVWLKQMSTMTADGSVGNWIASKLLTVTKFLGLK